MQTANVTYRIESARDEMLDADYALILQAANGGVCYCAECDNARLLAESRIAWSY